MLEMPRRGTRLGGVRPEASPDSILRGPLRRLVRGASPRDPSRAAHHRWARLFRTPFSACRWESLRNGDCSAPSRGTSADLSRASCDGLSRGPDSTSPRTSSPRRRSGKSPGSLTQRRRRRWDVDQTTYGRAFARCTARVVNGVRAKPSAPVTRRTNPVEGRATPRCFQPVATRRSAVGVRRSDSRVARRF